MIATVSKGWFKELETYGVDIVCGEDDVLILACVLTIDMIEAIKIRLVSLFFCLLRLKWLALLSVWSFWLLFRTNG